MESTGLRMAALLLSRVTVTTVMMVIKARWLWKFLCQPALLLSVMSLREKPL